MFGCISKHDWIRGQVAIITFISYISFKISRKPITIMKTAKSFLSCNVVANNISNCTSFITEMDNKSQIVANGYLGSLDTVYLISYFFFMFISGYIADRVNLRYFLSFSCIMSGLITSAFGIDYYLGIHSIWYFLIIQVVVGMFQSMGWPGLVTVMGNWFKKKKMGVIFGIWNSHHCIGNILGALIASSFLKEEWNFNWGLAFIIPGIILVVNGIIILLFLVPSPEYMNNVKDMASQNNLDDIVDLDAEEQMEDKKEISIPKKKPLSLLEALRIPGVVEYSFCFFFTKLVSNTFLFWLPKFIHHSSNVDANNVGMVSIYFDLGGIFGGIIAGVLADYSGMSGTTCVGMLLLAIPVKFAYNGVSNSWWRLTTVLGIPIINFCYLTNMLLLLLCGLLVNGPYALITTAVSAQLGSHESLKGSATAMATVTAIISGTGSAGAAVGPFITSWMVATEDDGSWRKVFYMLMMADFLAILLLIRIVKNEIKQYLQKIKDIETPKVTRL